MLFVSVKLQAMNPVREHYEAYPYPNYPLSARIRRCDTYALSLETLWGRFNNELLPEDARHVLIAGCGSFSPYPFSLSNPDCKITALDLSAANLRRARLHCLLNMRHNIDFIQGDLLDAQFGNRKFGFIDAFGVLHHLPDPNAGLSALIKHLLPGGIIRLMLYSTAARRRTEAARRLLQRMQVTDFKQLRQLEKRLPAGSALRQALDDSPEQRDKSGVADAFLHPLVHTFTVKQLERLIADNNLQLLLFGHDNALADPVDELHRLYSLEKSRELDFNFQVYLGKDGVCQPTKTKGRFVKTNPALVSKLPLFRLPQGRLGSELPVFTKAVRKLLHRCRTPQKWESLATEEQQLAQILEQHLLMYILQYPH